jgi:hypothetical protein
MKILGSAAIVPCTDRDGAVRRFTEAFGQPPLHEFEIEGRDLRVSVFPGISVLSGPAPALETLAGLRATVFVESLSEVALDLTQNGWVAVGSLGGPSSLLARDPEGNVLEFVENPGASG